MSNEQKIPKRIFIVPYRNRIQNKFFFCKYMNFILEDCDDYEIYFSHQCDARTFNRGAIKNLGFIAAKNKYPQHYKDITFIFNDVDTIPFYKIFDYETQKSYDIEITSNDGDNKLTQNFTINILIINEIPTNITLSNNTINENKQVGTFIGTLNTEDEDLNNTFTISSI